MVGLKESADAIRTYALDRIKEMRLLDETFRIPEGINHASLFDNIIGVTTSKAPVRVVKLLAEPTQAKYFRALPFHTSQQEEIHDRFSVFTFRLKLNYELVHEILSLGAAVKVLQPRELVVMVTQELEKALSLYDASASFPAPR